MSINNKNNQYLLIKSLGLPQFSDIYTLSICTGLSTKLIYNLSTNQVKYYREFTIPKKNGTHRTIYAPKYTMHMLQKWILRNILDKVVPSNRAMAFRRGKGFGYKANANYHIDTIYGLAMDLKDFFPSITANKVYKIFYQLGYNKMAATLLTNICTIDKKLPTGGVCSPALSNLICNTLDHRLIGLCDKRGIRYSRYADDLYFSCDNKDSLHKICNTVVKIISDEGFTVNEKKTRYQSPKCRKEITGITISKVQNKDQNELKASKKKKRDIRSEVFHAIMSGDYSQKEHIVGVIASIDYIENNGAHTYLNNMKQYIESCGKKIIYFKELVERYNSNLFYKTQQVITYVPPIVDKNKIDENRVRDLEEILYERIQFLDKNKIDDICSYCDWPEDLYDEDNDFPF